MPMRHWLGRHEARAVRADQAHARAAQRGLGAQHVEHRDALGDAGRERDAGVGRLEDRVGRAGRRHEDHGGVGARLLHGVAHGVEHRDLVDDAAALAGRHAADHLRAVLAREPRVELPHLPEALHQQLRVLVAQDRHSGPRPRAAATAFSPASRSVSAGVMSSPEAARIWRPSAAFVPCSRTTSGT